MEFHEEKHHDHPGRRDDDGDGIGDDGGEEDEDIDPHAQKISVLVHGKYTRPPSLKLWWTRPSSVKLCRDGDGWDRCQRAEERQNSPHPTHNAQVSERTEGPNGGVGHTAGEATLLGLLGRRRRDGFGERARGKRNGAGL